MTQRYVTITADHRDCKQHPQIFAAKSLAKAIPEAVGELEVSHGGNVIWQQFNYTRKATQSRKGRLNRAGRRWLKFALAGKGMANRKAVINIVCDKLP